MFHLATFDEIAGIAHGIETTNPAMVDRIRRAADRTDRLAKQRALIRAGEHPALSMLDSR